MDHQYEGHVEQYQWRSDKECPESVKCYRTNLYQENKRVMCGLHDSVTRTCAGYYRTDDYKSINVLMNPTLIYNNKEAACHCSN